jgi:hypothetical protein
MESSIRVTRADRRTLLNLCGNRYSVPPQLKDTTVMVRANSSEVRVLADGKLVACHNRCYDRNQRFNLPDHRLAALKLTHLFTALGYTACERGITVRFTRVIAMIDRLMRHGDAIAIQGNTSV